MSIAVSAIVSPSRALRALLAAYGLANLAAAGAVGLAMPGLFKLARLLAIFLALAGVVLLRCASALTKTRRIDISGLGQLRLTVQQDMRTGGGDGVPATLMPGSTVWPWLMLLHLATEDGRRVLLPVLPDSVAPGVYRALAVAVRWRGRALQAQHKIL